MEKERASSEELIKAYRQMDHLMEKVSYLGTRAQYKMFKEHSLIREGALSAIYSDFVSNKYGFDDMDARLKTYYQGLEDNLNDVNSNEANFYLNFEYLEDDFTKTEFANYVERRVKDTNSGLIIPGQSLIRVSASMAVMGFALAQLFDNNLEGSIYNGIIAGTIPSIFAGVYQMRGRVRSQKFWSILEKDIDDQFETIVNHARNIELIPHLEQITEKLESERNHQLIMAWDEGNDELAKKLSSN